eukprot:6208564-Pleurochrysis_carterae.AAC.6
MHLQRQLVILEQYDTFCHRAGRRIVSITLEKLLKDNGDSDSILSMQTLLPHKYVVPTKTL